MAGEHDIEEKARAALRSEPRLDLRQYPIELAFDGVTMTMDGEVAAVSQKKLVLEAVAALPEVTGIVDRVHVLPAEPMGDGEVRAMMRDALIEEPALLEFAVKEDRAGQFEIARDAPAGARGEIRFAVEEGVVTLSGTVPGLAYKRLAGVLAWWIPGSRDVVNGLAVEPPDEDSAHEMADAVRLALEKDPFVDASQIRVTARDRTVTLQGLVPKQGEREMAENDAWYVFGVDRVENEIEVRP